MSEIELEIRIWPDDLTVIQTALDELAQSRAVSEAAAGSLRLALEELVANVFDHGDPGREVRVRIKAAHDRLEAEVIDHGPPFDPLTHPDPDVGASLDERQTGGLGVFLVKQLMDQVVYRRSAAANHVQLTKLCLPAAGDEEPSADP